MKRPVIALAGANGQIGRYVIEKLKAHFDIIALSGDGDGRDTEHVTWRSCDLYSVSDIKTCLAGADIAVYLTDSMLYKAKLTQGSLQDLHTMAADNFAIAAKNQGIKRMIYCSTSIPDILPELSGVEERLGSYEVPVTTIRSDRIRKSVRTSFSKKAQTHHNDVRSVQRIPAPEGWTPEDIGLQYVRWLGEVLSPFVHTSVDVNQSCQIRLLCLKKPLIKMTYDEGQSTPSLAVYSITGGRLVDPGQHHHARFEFRKITGKSESIAAIHDYVPSLPWPIYRVTQAIAHRLIMAWFRSHMSKLTSYL